MSLVQHLEALEGEGHLASRVNASGIRLWSVCSNSIVQIASTRGTISLVGGDAIAVFSSENAAHHTTVMIYNNGLDNTHPDYRIGMMSRNINETRGFFRVAPTAPAKALKKSSK
jgi:hypothetical protein